MYKDLKNTNFSITLKEMSGERSVNNKIKSKLSSYDINNKEKNYIVSFDTDYRKEIVAKNTTGAATEYKIIISTIFAVKSSNIQKTFEFNESFNMQSNSDKLDEQDYEESIKESLANIIARKLILQISQIQ
tara:strand:+ start:113 stop:505 length:393 start_codon:yes stop_codon:yes gene_type:complete